MDHVVERRKNRRSGREGLEELDISLTDALMKS